MCIRDSLLDNTLLIPEYRDISVPPSIADLHNYYFYTWSDFGSLASFEGISRVWYAFRLLFSPDVNVFIRFTFFLYYVVMFFIPYLSFFYLLKNFLNYDRNVSFLTAMIIACFYSFNPYVIQSYSPPHMYVTSYALLPALVTSLVLDLKKPNFSFPRFFSRISIC